LPPIVALKVSGYWEAEWFPQMFRFLTYFEGVEVCRAIMLVARF